MLCRRVDAPLGTNTLTLRRARCNSFLSAVRPLIVLAAVCALAAAQNRHSLPPLATDARCKDGGLRIGSALRQFPRSGTIADAWEIWRGPHHLYAHNRPRRIDANHVEYALIVYTDPFGYLYEMADGNYLLDFRYAQPGISKLPRASVRAILREIGDRMPPAKHLSVEPCFSSTPQVPTT